MSRLYYDVRLEEEYRKHPHQYVTHHLPHFQQIKDWLPKEWDRCNIPSTFYGILKNKITTCAMNCIEKPDGIAIARITIQFVPGFRLTKKRRNECWEQMNGQLTDGFGESYDQHPIPGANPGWVLSL